MSSIPVVVLGGIGYVAAEAVRLLANHPHFELGAVVSSSQAGQPLVHSFPHLRGLLTDDLPFLTQAEALDLSANWSNFGLVCALPHGTAAEELKVWIDAARGRIKVVDLSADFRFNDLEFYREWYGDHHGAPELAPEFLCSVPEHSTQIGDFVAHPGCFTTAAVLALAPLFATGWFEKSVMVHGTTGSTGSGRTPKVGTHHPERHSGMWSYQPLTHRHQPEMEGLVKAHAGRAPVVSFVPNSGPFSRGIHASLFLTAKGTLTREDVFECLQGAYENSLLVHVVNEMPSVKHVAGTNNCLISAEVKGATVYVASVIDNLLKGAAGGGIQWLNRQFGLDEYAGLLTGGSGWG